MVCNLFRVNSDGGDKFDDSETQQTSDVVFAIVIILLIPCAF
jgi:hypothetical protein